MFKALEREVAKLEDVFRALRGRDDLLRAYENDWNRICKPVASFDQGPLLLLTRFTKTEDEHWSAKGAPPVAPFPKHDYFVPIVSFMIESNAVFIPKSREMMTSWLSCGYITWMCLTRPHIFWLIQTDKKDKALQLVEYCRILYRNSEKWIKLRVPLISDTKQELRWANGSHVRAVPSGVHQVRAYHPYGYFMDEAAFIPDAELCFNAARPVAKQIIAVSSDGLGWFHDQCNLQ